MFCSLIFAALAITVGPGDDLVQARNRARAEANAEVVLRAGVYRLKSTLKFSSADSGVVWRAAEGAKVEIAGGVELPAAAFRPWNEKPGVLVADLSAYPIEYWKDFKREFTLPLPVPELFVDGRRMSVAAWPNDGGFTDVAKIVDGGTRLSDGSPFNKLPPPQERRGATFLTPQTRPFAWKDPGSAWLHGYWCFDWYDSVIPGAAFTHETNGMTRVTLAYPHCYGMKDAANKAPRRWRALHLLEELDAPGEYFVDRAAKRLYFMPERPLAADSRIVLTFGEYPLFSLNSASNIVFRGISFTEGFGMALKAHKCSGVRLERCRFSNLRALAADFTACTACRVSDCEVVDTGTGGISMVGGDRRTLTRGENVIERSVFRRFSTLRPVYTPGVRLGGCGNTARHCELTDTPHMAASMTGNDNVFEHCVISNACTCSDDASAFYKGRNPSCTGNVIRHCLFSDIGSVRRHGNAAIYFDDGDCGERVEHCTFRRVLSPARSGFGAVFCHGGYSNVVADCVFEDCERPLGYSKWKQDRWLQFIGGEMFPYMKQRLKKDVDVESPLFQERYPFLRGFMAGVPETNRCNVAVNCEFRNCRQEPKGHWELINCK